MGKVFSYEPKDHIHDPDEDKGQNCRLERRKPIIGFSKEHVHNTPKHDVKLKHGDFNSSHGDVLKGFRSITDH